MFSKKALAGLKKCAGADTGAARSIVKVSSFNAFCDWVAFGGDVLTSADPIENEKRVKYTTLVANAVMLNNVVDLTNVLVRLAREGYPITPELLSGLSPYLTGHIRRFGQFVLDVDSLPLPLIPEKIPLARAAKGAPA